MAENTYNKTFQRSVPIQIKSVPMRLLQDRNQIRFTGIVVNYNEGRYLHNCLKGLAFCKQLIVIDLGSSDASIEIAKQYGAEIIHHERVSIVEQIWDEAVSYARNDWIVLADPDEVFPANVADHLQTLIDKDPKLGLINIPLQYYFKNRPLFFTVWGMKRARRSLLHKERNRFSPNVHRGIQLLEGYNCVELPWKPDCIIKHYWIDSFYQLFKKHWRYIKREGESRYHVGERFSWRRWTRDTIVALRLNLFDYDGIRGGFLGIFLSGFYSWYVAMSLLSLRRYQNLSRLK